MLAPSLCDQMTYQQANNHCNRLGWLLDHLKEDVETLADAVWGEEVGAIRMADADDPCEREPDREDQPPAPPAGPLNSTF